MKTIGLALLAISLVSLAGCHWHHYDRHRYYDDRRYGSYDEPYYDRGRYRSYGRYDRGYGRYPGYYRSRSED
ncbi:MAG: hypothetical protein HY695_10590 [Deltaproteobacteria bacterium]|nr:hypothetical protein [Deltaproteobacteria bacterium]